MIKIDCKVKLDKYLYLGKTLIYTSVYTVMITIIILYQDAAEL